MSDFSANAVLSFDPATERFTATYPGSGPNANVRQILGRNGEVFLPEVGARPGGGRTYRGWRALRN